MCHIQSKCHWISLYFTNFSNIMNKSWCYTLREVFVDEDSNFDLDVADSGISIKFNSSEQFSKRAKQIGKIVQKWQFSDSSMLKMDVDELGRRRKYSSDTSNIPLILQRLLKDSERIFIIILKTKNWALCNCVGHSVLLLRDMCQIWWLYLT